MERADISVLICTYNHEKYIGQAIESVLAQETDYKFEIIVGDDASADRTPEIISKYAERCPAIVPILRKQNLGATRNVYGMAQKATGKYVMGFDGDDFILGKDRIQWQADFLESHPEYSSVCGKCRLVDEEGGPFPESSIKEIARFWQFDKEVFDWEDFEGWKMPGHGSARMSRNFWLRGNSDVFYKAHNTVGDRTALMLCLFGGPVRCVDKIASCYRIRSGSENFMSRYAKKNPRAEDVHLMRCLEEYAASRGRKLDLSATKKLRLVEAICIWMKEPTKHNLHVTQKIIEETENDPAYITLAVKALILKSYYWHTLHEDRQIDIT